MWKDYTLSPNASNAKPAIRRTYSFNRCSTHRIANEPPTLGHTMGRWLANARTWPHQGKACAFLKVLAGAPGFEALGWSGTGKMPVGGPLGRGWGGVEGARPLVGASSYATGGGEP